MSRRKRLPLLVAACVLLLLSARAGYGCSCARKQSVLEEYERADVVVMARAVSLEMAPKKPDEAEEPKGVKDAVAEKPGEAKQDEEDESWRRVVSTKMLVERVYKGGLKVGEEMVFAQGGGADCIYTFGKEAVGRSYLFYLRRLKGADHWIAGTCGRSSPVERAHDDLLYLNNLDKTRGRTRISGTLDYFMAEGPVPAGLKLSIKGGGKTFETKTDEHGVYEIYDLPAGRYTVETEVPQGWKVGSFSLPSPGGPEIGDDERSPKKIPISLEDKRHVALDIAFMIDNAVSGKVFDTSGKPLDGVCLQLLPARGEIPQHYYEGDCTENGGRFRFGEVTPGDYVIALNQKNKITSDEPFATFYYPNARTREEATVIHVGLGDFVEDIQIHVTKMEETVTVEGVLLYSDGKPVADEFVEFRREQNRDEDEPVDSQQKTDAKGRFTLKILKGQKGSFYGSMYAYLGEYVNCPRLDSLIRKTGDTTAELKTTAVEVQADNNLYGVELRFPFPGCKKAKID